MRATFPGVFSADRCVATRVGVLRSIRYVSVLLLPLAAPAALAAFPGQNGRIAYVNSNSHYAIFLTGTGQLTFPNATFQHDYDPAISPDGSRVAFIRENDTSFGYQDLLETIGIDGEDQRLVLNTNSLVPGGTIPYQFHFLRHPAWSADGHRISFLVDEVRTATGQVTQTDGIWTINKDGSGLTQEASAVEGSGYTLDYPAWSPSGTRLAYECRSFSSVIADICVRDEATGVVQRLPVEVPDHSVVLGIDGLKWTADGKKLLFVFDNDVYWINADGSKNADGSGIEQLTFGASAGGTCRQMSYSGATPSPDGQYIVAVGWRSVPGIDGLGRHICLQTDVGLYLISGSALTVWPLDHSPGRGLASTDWQPLPDALTFRIDDGHGDLLNGLQVELRNSDDSIRDAGPINTTGGIYVFERAVPPGDYILRATLVDRCGLACAPTFDVRYGLGADEPVWFEWDVKVPASATDLFDLDFDESDVRLVNCSVCADAGLAVDRLDDMAAIYYWTRQYVDWIKAHVTLHTGATANLYTFASSDPITGEAVTSTDAYTRGTNVLVFGSDASDFENRDGIVDGAHDDDGPMNEEWHEFTHHLFATFVHLGCPGDDNHKGYNNPDTCDSLNEGFAEFLPTLAAEDVPTPGVHASGYYDGVWSLRWPTEAWGYRAGLNHSGSTEELAVAALLWDLVDDDSNTLATQIVGIDAQYHPVEYADSFVMPIEQLWNTLASSHAATVFDLRGALGAPSATIDLDGDASADVAPIDIPFLMHGFFPADTNQAITPTHKSYYYDVRYNFISGFLGNIVGKSDHYAYDASGNVEAALIPRDNTPIPRNSAIEVNVLDASGAPLSGATIDMQIDYPGGQDIVERQLDSGAGALLHLELPPYFNYLLPDGAPLPACDPSNDVRVTVTLTAKKDGTTSAETPSFDNCTFLHAVEAATAPPALSFTLTVPVLGGGTGATYTVGGTVAGLAGTVVLINGADRLSVSADGDFAFPTAVASGTVYSVSVAVQPEGQQCTVSNGSGTVAATSVMNIEVTCVNVQQDVTASLTLSRTGFVLNRRTGTLNSLITLTNGSATTFGTPMWLVVSGLPNGTSLANATGTTEQGDPYILLSPAGGELAPNTSYTQLISVRDPTLAPINPTLRVLAVPAH